MGKATVSGKGARTRKVKARKPIRESLSRWISLGEILSRERKYIALVWAVKSLSTYLIGREFVAETNHAPLLYLNSAKSRMAAYE